jgi:membrane-associated phospholipid phosphatase
MSPLPFHLVLAYLAAHAVLVLVSPTPGRRRAMIAGIDLLLMLFCSLILAVLPAEPGRLSGTLRTLLLWAPLCFFWWAYFWAKHTLTALHPKEQRLDEWLIRLENRIGQPSLSWAARPRPWLSEILHLGYLSYYLYTPVLGIWMQLAGRERDFQSMSAAVCGGYLVAYVLFALTPAEGPRWSLVDKGLLDPGRRIPEGLVLTRLTAWILYRGPAHRGGAMPSSHTSTAVVFAVWAWRLGGPEAGVPAVLLATAMALGAVYGRYHFVADVAAGAALGAISLRFADWMTSP